MYFQLHSHDITLVGTKPLHTKQCLAELSLRIIPYDPPNRLREALGIGENPTQEPKIYSLAPPKKSPLIDLLLSLFRLINLYIQALFVSVVIPVVSLFFNFRIYAHTCHVNFN